MEHAVPPRSSGGKGVAPSPRSGSPRNVAERRLRYGESALTALRLLSALSLCAVLATLLRVSLTRFLRWSVGQAYQGVLPSNLFANVLGCVIMGFLAPQKGLSLWKREGWLYVAMTSGFCGSLTTLSSWMKDAVAALGRVEVVHYLLLIFLELFSNFCAFTFGLHLYSTVTAIGTRTPTSFLSKRFQVIHDHSDSSSHQQQQEVEEDGEYSDVSLATSGQNEEAPTDKPLKRLLWTALLPTVLLSLAVLTLSILSVNLETWRWLMFSALFAPFGALLRYYLSLFNAKEPYASGFPLFTFIPNLAGCLFAAAMHILAANKGWTDRSSPGAYLVEASMTGFSGCLTTVSTFMAELMQPHRALPLRYLYGACTVSIAQASMLLLFWAFLW
ncbi:Camphor resistance CrcB protein [Balamuthia mandrillaris]